MTVPIWIKLPGLDFKYWSVKALGKLGSLVGKPLMVDENTKQNRFEFCKITGGSETGNTFVEMHLL